MTNDVDIVEADQGELDIQSVLAAVREFSVIDTQEKALAKRKTVLKARLRGLVELEGEEDDKGNLLWPLPEQCGDITALQLQCRVSRPFDGEVATAILQSIDVGSQTLWHQCIEWTPVLDEGKVMAAHYRDEISERQIDAMYPENISYAFVPIKQGH